MISKKRETGKMGGFGSGRSRRASATCESSTAPISRTLGAISCFSRAPAQRSLGRAAACAQDRSGSWSSKVRLLYTTSEGDGATVHVNELVPFVTTATSFSGRRPWLQCLSCHRRCRVVYGGQYFRCRQCHCLSYQSQREPSYGRAIAGNPYSEAIGR